ncbi:hypothetical protein BRM29_02210, partial [Xanthomonas oryzae pv. oryzae]
MRVDAPELRIRSARSGLSRRGLFAYAPLKTASTQHTTRGAPTAAATKKPQGYVLPTSAHRRCLGAYAAP